MKFKYFLICIPNFGKDKILKLMRELPQQAGKKKITHLHSFETKVSFFQLLTSPENCLKILLKMTPPVPASRTTIKPPSQRTSEASPKTRQPISSTNANLTPCRNCGRNFATDRVSRHESICKKTATKKRKVFDPVKHRVEGTEAAKYVLTGINERNAKKAEVINIVLLIQQSINRDRAIFLTINPENFIQFTH